MHRQRRRSPSSAQTPTTSAPSQEVTGVGNQATLSDLDADTPEWEFLHAVGEGFGMGAGVLVTELLALLPSWREPVLDEQGQPAQSVPGADRIGDYDIQKRHTQVVGPQLESYAEGLEEGWFKDLVDGVGEGATDAPGTSYRLESAVGGLFSGDD
jgi:hypothetical protein